MLIDLSSLSTPYLDPWQYPEQLVVYLEYGEISYYNHTLREGRRQSTVLSTEGLNDLRPFPDAAQFGGDAARYDGDDVWEFHIHVTNKERSSHSYDGYVTLIKRKTGGWACTVRDAQSTTTCICILRGYDPSPRPLAVKTPSPPSAWERL